MSNERASLRQLVVVAILAAMLLLAVVLLGVRLYKPPAEEMPEVISNFLSEYLAEGYVTTEDSNVFHNYFDCLTEEELAAEPGAGETELAFDQVFKIYSYGRKSYKAVQASPGFVIVRLFDENEELMTPPIGFWYRLSADDSKISEWRIGRLQPFSRYDTEYSELWEELYG